MSGPFSPRRDGALDVTLSEPEVALVGSVVQQMDQVLEAPEQTPHTDRLFPPAYAGEPEHNEEYEHLVHDDLVQERLGNIQVLEETAEAERLSEEQLAASLARGASGATRVGRRTAMYRRA